MTDAPGMPRIGDTAPDFTATTTQGQLSFHAWKGENWAMRAPSDRHIDPMAGHQSGCAGA